MSIPPQASFSSESTAVASRATVYPSFEELTSFKLPAKDDIVDSTIADTSDSSNGLKHTRQLVPNPSTPRHPSPASSETSGREFTPDDTPSTIHGESMFYPRHPLANRTPFTKVPVSPRWPFQNATPRTTAMVPISQSVTSSSRTLNPNARRSTIGHVSVSESLDEFQISHPNAKLLSLHPRPLTYNQTGRNLARIPELVEKPEWNVRPVRGVPMAHPEKPRRFLKIRLRRRRRCGDEGGRGRSAKPRTVWYQRISVDKKVFRAAAGVTMFFLVNSFVSASALITLATARIPVPHGVVVWVIVSLSTCAFTLTTLYLMRKFRNAVALDEERRGRPPRPKLSFDASHMCNMDLPASPTEILHRRQLGAAAAAADEHEQMMQVERADMTGAAQPCPAGPFGTFTPPHYPRDDYDASAVADSYWTDNSVVVSAGSEASSRTAVIPSTPNSTTEQKRQVGLFEMGTGPQREDGEDGSGGLEFSRWDGWLAWD
ncbi:hypothetical protein LX32DRAFT_706440 [Colletotrichum zoysiae]|uniref:Transmembrane protein n=1 Tax=Colletotrichum zoysiae TaxID=1216348 RepID=A0AAD9HPW8_9PEZI|nr:hypothetical protein LX32DRAFT_706440 [Colletotrichum zoysiae]